MPLLGINSFLDQLSLRKLVTPPEHRVFTITYSAPNTNFMFNKMLNSDQIEHWICTAIKLSQKLRKNFLIETKKTTFLQNIKTRTSNSFWHRSNSMVVFVTSRSFLFNISKTKGLIIQNFTFMCKNYIHARHIVPEHNIVINELL